LNCTFQTFAWIKFQEYSSSWKNRQNSVGFIEDYTLPWNTVTSNCIRRFTAKDNLILTQFLFTSFNKQATQLLKRD
jgi:hypothetical protein